MHKLNDKASKRKQEKIFLSLVSANTPIKDPESINHKRKRLKLKPVLQ